MVNGNVGKKVFDDDGVHIGWTSRAKRRKKAQGLFPKEICFILASRCTWRAFYIV